MGDLDKYIWQDDDLQVVETTDKSLSSDEQIAFMTDVMGFPREQAEFIYAIETGEIDGDIEYDPPLPKAETPKENPR